jgi:hypothetical protein
MLEEGHGGKIIFKEFGPGKGWRLHAVHRLIKKIKDTGSTNKKKVGGQGRQRQMKIGSTWRRSLYPRKMNTGVINHNERLRQS